MARPLYRPVIGLEQQEIEVQDETHAFGSAEEFTTSEDPHCKDGGKACIDCLMRGECLHKAPECVYCEGTGIDPKVSEARWSWHAQPARCQITPEMTRAVGSIDLLYDTRKNT